MAEYFRDVEGRDVLLFIDNIFRFTQAGSEVSALLGRMPSRRRLPADAGHRDGRAAGAHHLDQEGLDHLAAGDLRAGRRLHRPGAGHDLRATSTRRSRSSASIAERGIYPAVDPLASTSRILDPRVVGEEHYDVAREVQRILQRYKDLQDIIAILGMDELSRGGQADGRPRARGSQRFLSQPMFVAEQFTGRRASTSSSRRRSAASERSWRASTTTLPEQAFYMVGPIEDVVANAEEMK